jgi:hypothetical protein
MGSFSLNSVFSLGAITVEAACGSEAVIQEEEVAEPFIPSPYLSGGEIAAIVVCVVFGVILLPSVILVICCCCKKKNAQVLNNSRVVDDK